MRLMICTCFPCVCVCVSVYCCLLPLTASEFNVTLRLKAENVELEEARLLDNDLGKIPTS
jgi:hypothetical protein